MSAHPPIEERLRAALDALARLISAHDLSPARPRPAGRGGPGGYGASCRP